MLELAAQIPNLEVEERAITLHEVAITIIATIIVLIVTITINIAIITLWTKFKIMTIGRFLRRMPKGSYWRCLAQALLPPYHKLAISGCTVILTISVVTISIIVIIIIALTRFDGKDHPVVQTTKII